MKHVMDAETVHNWRNRFEKTAHYADLSAGARLMVGRAHDDHHKTGTRTAGEWAAALIELYPAEFSRTGA